MMKNEEIGKIIVHKDMVNVKAKNKRVHIFKRENGRFHIEIINLNKSKNHFSSVAFKSLRRNVTVNSIFLSKISIESLIVRYMEMKRGEECENYKNRIYMNQIEE